MLDETRFTSTMNPFYGQFAANNGSIQKHTYVHGLTTTSNS